MDCGGLSVPEPIASCDSGDVNPATGADHRPEEASSTPTSGVVRAETPTASDTENDHDNGGVENENGGSGDSSGNGVHISESRHQQQGIHPFIQSLIQQQQLQHRLHPTPPPGGAHPQQQQQQWLHAAALSSQLLLPGLSHHPFLKNFAHGHEHGQHEHSPHHRPHPQVGVAPRMPSAASMLPAAAQGQPPHLHQPAPAASQRFPPEFAGLMNHFHSSAGAQRFPGSLPPHHNVMRVKSTASTVGRRTSCVVCRKPLDPGESDCLILESLTLTTSNLSFSEKLEDIVGFSLSALGKSTDFICKRCMGLVSLVDRIELELNAAKEQIVVLFREGNFGTHRHLHHYHHQLVESTSGGADPSMIIDAVGGTSSSKEESEDECSELSARRRSGTAGTSRDDAAGATKVNGDSTPSIHVQGFPRRRSSSGGDYDDLVIRRNSVMGAEMTDAPATKRRSDLSGVDEDDERRRRRRLSVCGDDANADEARCARSNSYGSESEDSESREMFDSDDVDDDEDEPDGVSDSDDDAVKTPSSASGVPRHVAEDIIDLSRGAPLEEVEKPADGVVEKPAAPYARQPINCEYCDESFNKSHHYEYHLNKTHLKEAPYLCAVCRKAFFSDFALTTHVGRRRHFATAEDRLLAIGEDQSFFDPSAKPQAVRWKCRACAHTAKTKAALRFHVAKAHVPPRGRFPCRRCGRGFMQASALEAHVNKEHLHHRPFPCDDCDKAFFSRAALRSHKTAKLGPVVERLHAAAASGAGTPPTPPQMPVFPFDRSKFGSPAGPGIHLPGAQTPSQQQPPGPGPGPPPPLPQPRAPPPQPPVVACPLCLMLFPSEGSLMQHQRSGSCAGGMAAAAAAAMNLNPFAAAAAAAQAASHHQHHHPPSGTMGVDGTSVAAASMAAAAAAGSMMNQMKSFLCRNCGEAYRTKDALDRHLWLVHSIKAENVVIYRCDECGKEYTKKQRYDTHMMLHRGERPHRCPYCKYDTNIRGNLRLHVKNVHKVELPLMRRKRGQD